jgi:hypothetical protein
MPGDGGQDDRMPHHQLVVAPFRQQAKQGTPRQWPPSLRCPGQLPPPASLVEGTRPSRHHSRHLANLGSMDRLPVRARCPGGTASRPGEGRLYFNRVRCD